MVVLTDVDSWTPLRYNFQPLVVSKVTVPKYQVFNDKEVVHITVLQDPLWPACNLFVPANQNACCPLFPPDIIFDPVYDGILNQAIFV